MWNLGKYVNIYVFLASFSIGMFVVYTTMNDQRKIYVYPTPENVDLILYKDKTNTCFGFKEKEVDCPTDESKITKVVAQA